MRVSEQFSEHGGYPEITQTGVPEGRSEAVSPERFQRIARRGERAVSRRERFQTGSRGLQRRWPEIEEQAYRAVQEPWGGASYRATSGKPVVGGDRFAVAARPPEVEHISLPLTVSRQQFGEAMQTARRRFAPQLRQWGSALGVFHDVDRGAIEIDPATITRSERTAKNIGAYTHATGGAYHFKTGLGIYPPHVHRNVRD